MRIREITRHMGDEEIIARTLYGEIRDGDDAAMRHVSWVIWNRAHCNRKQWGTTLREVCLKPWQFSCWWERNANTRAMLTATQDDPLYRRCLAEAEALLSGDFRNQLDPTQGSVYYKTASVYPAWAAAATIHQTLYDGYHQFFCEDGIKTQNQFTAGDSEPPSDATFSSAAPSAMGLKQQIRSDLIQFIDPAEAKKLRAWLARGHYVGQNQKPNVPLDLRATLESFFLFANFNCIGTVFDSVDGHTTQEAGDAIKAKQKELHLALTGKLDLRLFNAIFPPEAKHETKKHVAKKQRLARQPVKQATPAIPAPTAPTPPWPPAYDATDHSNLGDILRTYERIFAARDNRPLQAAENHYEMTDPAILAFKMGLLALRDSPTLANALNLQPNNLTAIGVLQQFANALNPERQTLTTKDVANFQSLLKTLQHAASSAFTTPGMALNSLATKGNGQTIDNATARALATILRVVARYNQAKAGQTLQPKQSPSQP